MIRAVGVYWKKGIVKAPLHFQLCLGVVGGLAATPADVQDMLAYIQRLQAEGNLPKEVTVSGFGIGKGHLPVMFSALANGCHIRVGMEDNVVYGYDKEGKKILLEGQLGSLKDPDHGIYPMVTSSSTLAAYGAIGAGIPPYEIKDITTVVKAYSSAVGAGAFVSEIFGDEAEELRNRGGDGGEYGATTGRPRRVGWFDAVATRYGCRIQGATEVAFTVLDVLGYLDEIPVCIGYEIDGEVTRDFPTTAKLEKAKPVFTKLPGWKTDIRGIKNYADLPENCRKYIEFVEKEIEVPITMVSNGPGRDDIILK